MSDDPHREKYDSLVGVLKSLLRAARPRWWDIPGWVWRRRREEWVLVCASYGWPQWFYEAVRCGVDPVTLRAYAHLLDIPYHENPRSYRMVPA